MCQGEVNGMAYVISNVLVAQWQMIVKFRVTSSCTESIHFEILTGRMTE